MSIPQSFEKALHSELLTQGMNAYPLFLHGAAAWLNGWRMADRLGIEYTGYLFMHENGYSQSSYFADDLKRLWAAIEPELVAEPMYIQKVKAEYEREYAEATTRVNEHIARYAADLSDASDQELIALLQEAFVALPTSVGLSHIIEPISYGVEELFRSRLREETASEDEYRSYFSILTTPTERSFIAQEEHALQQIAALFGTVEEEELEAALAKHIADFGWIMNTYQGPRAMTGSELRKRFTMVHDSTSVDEQAQKRQQAISDGGFSEELLHLASIINEVTIWQDERKAHMLQSIGRVGVVTEVLAQRAGIDSALMYQMSVNDILELKHINQLQSDGYQAELVERYSGAAYLITPAGSEVMYGEQYEEFKKRQQEMIAAQDESEVNEHSEDEIRGSIANIGTAVGKVRVCMTLDSVSDVEEGDILVTSMTRPEFMPALKKAAAIVTDEGGITSHAAIVSRELGIPAIIGTKLATKVLKDGMQVEVRANHGFVRIID